MCIIHPLFRSRREARTSRWARGSWSASPGRCYVSLSFFFKKTPLGAQKNSGKRLKDFAAREVVWLIPGKTKILILDEATAAVDLETDDLIQVIAEKLLSLSEHF